MYLKPKQAVDTLDRTVSFNTYNSELDACDYVETEKIIRTDSSDLVILQLNVRGLYGKLNSLKTLLDKSTKRKKPDVLLLCETWQSKLSLVPKLEGYSYLHKYHKHKMGSGVGMFISNRLKYRERPDLELDSEIFEHCCAEIKLKHSELLMCSGYRAPNSSPTDFLNEYNKLLKNVSDSKLQFVMGMDHNLDFLKHKTHKPTRSFIELLSEASLVPSITHPTRIMKSSATLIDNIFIPMQLVPKIDSYILIDDMSDHLSMLTIIRTTELGPRPKRQIVTRDMRKKNVELLKSKITNINWEEYLGVIPGRVAEGDVIPQNVNEMFDKCHNRVKDLIDDYMPIKTCTISEKKFQKEPWVTPGILKSSNKLKKLYKLSLSKNAGIHDTELYKTYRTLLTQVKRQARVEYYQNACTVHKSNTRKLWEIISQTIDKESNKTCIIEKLKVENIVYDSSSDIVNQMAHYFSTVGINMPIVKPNCVISEYLAKIQINNKSLFLTPTNYVEIKKNIGNLPNKNSSGYDEILNKLLKLLKKEISVPLELIFNKSLETGIFPNKIKNAEVVPLYKNKSQWEPVNYHPNSLLLTISKVLKKIEIRKKNLQLSGL